MNISVSGFKNKKWLLAFSFFTTQITLADIIIEEHPLTQIPSPSITQPEKKLPSTPLLAPTLEKQTLITPPKTEPSQIENTPVITKNPIWEMQQQINALQNQVSQLRGTVEEQSNTIDQLKTDLRTRYLDLDQRISTQTAPQEPIPQEPIPKETAPTVNTDQSKKDEAKAPEPNKNLPKEVAKEPSNNQDDKKSFLAAYDSFRNGGPDAAIVPMQNFIKNFPKSELLINAHYWLGEFYLNASKPNQNIAIKEFEIVLKTPEHSKAPAALYKIASIYDLQDKTKDAEKKMLELKAQFPKSAEAKLADDYLKALAPSKPTTKKDKKK
jgi:tol-pal system protein YbgF